LPEKFEILAEAAASTIHGKTKCDGKSAMHMMHFITFDT